MSPETAYGRQHLVCSLRCQNVSRPDFASAREPPRCQVVQASQHVGHPEWFRYGDQTALGAGNPTTVASAAAMDSELYDLLLYLIVNNLHHW